MSECVLVRYFGSSDIEEEKTTAKKVTKLCLGIGWKERNQQDATNLMFIIKLLSQHVSGIIMPIITRTRVCTAAYGVLHWLWWLWLCGAGTRAVCTVKVIVRTVTFTVHTARVPAPHNHIHHNQCRTPYAAVHTLVLVVMGIMMPETCWDKSLIINIRLVASCWFLSLHPRSFVIVTVWLGCMFIEGCDGRGTVGACGSKISEGKVHLEIMHRRSDSEDVK